MMHSQLFEGFKCESQIENNERAKNRGTLLDSQHFGGVEGACWSSEMGLRRIDKLHLLARAYTKPTQSG